MTVELRRFTHIAEVRQTIIDIYADVRADLLNHPNYRISAFSERLDRHGSEPGWTAVIAYDGTDPVGYAYANTIEPGNRWWTRMTSPAPDRFAQVPVVALKEIMVRVPWRGTGTARRIHDALLSGRQEAYVSLLVNPAAGDGKVQRLYESWGYHPISTQQPSPESPKLTAMIRSTDPAGAERSA